LIELFGKGTGIEALCVIIRLRIHFLLPDSLGREVTDEQLEQIEADEIGNDIQRDRLDCLDVSDDEDAGGSPTRLAVGHQLVHQRVVATPNLADRTRSQHSNINLLTIK
jgi:hypothetical protein